MGFVKPAPVKSGFNMDDYITVPERVTQFYAKFPDGSLQSEIVELTDSRVVMRSYAYRTPDDARPGIAHSFLNIPGTTPYTRGSEIENAETSSVGRAIAMLGFGVKRSIASRDEVATKTGKPNEPETAFDAGLVGIAEQGKGDADFELRQTPDGWALVFRLSEKAGSKAGIKVIVRNRLAEMLAEYRKGIEGERVTCWGAVSDETFEAKGAKPHTVHYSVLNLSRIKVGVLDLAEPDHEPSEDEEALIEELGDAAFPAPALVPAV